MLEIDCRRCKNCDTEHDCCSLYGDDPEKATKCCADNNFKDYDPD